MGVVPFLALSEEARARLGAIERRRRAPPTTRPRESTLALSREGDVWLVTSKTSAPFRVKHAKGMEYLDYLLRNPGREVYVLALAGAGEGPEDAGAILDDRAKQAYRRRVEELDDQLAEAERARRSRPREPRA